MAGHASRRRGLRAGSWALFFLALVAGCGDLQFVPSPYTPQEVELIYSAQEHLTVVRWRVSAAAPVAETRFEMLAPDGYHPINFSQSAYPGGVIACGDKRGSCAQYVVRGKYEVPRNARPVQAIHDVYGVLPGVPVASTKTVSETLKMKSFFHTGNDLVLVELTDDVALAGPYKFPRDYEQTMWPTAGLCVADTAPDDVRFSPLPETRGFAPPTPLTDDGMYCVATRPVPGDRGDARVVQTRVATLPEVISKTQIFDPTVERSPIIYQIFLDLEIPVPDRCEEVIQKIESLLQKYMSAGPSIPVYKLPTINLAQDGSSRCAQRNGRTVDAAEISQAVKDLVQTLPGKFHQYHLMYFNNLDAPLPSPLMPSMQSLVDALGSTSRDDLDLRTHSWLFAPITAAGTSPLTWWAVWIWQTADETFELALADYKLRSLPYTSQEHHSYDPVMLLSPEDTAAHDTHHIKICTSSPPVEPLSLVPYSAHDQRTELDDHDRRSTRVQGGAQHPDRGEGERVHRGGRDRELPDLHPLLRRAPLHHHQRHRGDLVGRQPFVREGGSVKRGPAAVAFVLALVLAARAAAGAEAVPAKTLVAGVPVAAASATPASGPGAAGPAAVPDVPPTGGATSLAAPGTAPAAKPLPSSQPSATGLPAVTTTSQRQAGALRDPAPRPPTDVRVQSRFAVKAKSAQLFGGAEYLSRGDFYNSPGARVGATYYPVESIGLELQVSHYWSSLNAEAERVKRTVGAAPGQPRPVVAAAGGRALLDRLRQADDRRAGRRDPLRAASLPSRRPARPRRRRRPVVRWRPRPARVPDAEGVRPHRRGRRLRSRGTFGGLRLRVGNAAVDLGGSAAVNRVSPIAAACVLTLGAGCSHRNLQSSGPFFGAGAPVAETRDELLVATGEAVWHGDLAAAHATLTRLADRERGKPDSALDFWSEMLALLRCEPLDRIPRSNVHDRPLSDPWDGLRRLAQIERIRLAREGKPAASSPVGGNLKPGLSERQMVWPVEAERWTDELPMPVVASHCGSGAPAPRPADGVVSIAHVASEPEVALVSSVADLLPPEHPATPLLLVQTAVAQYRPWRGGRGRRAARAAGTTDRREPDAGRTRARGDRGRAGHGGRSDVEARRGAGARAAPRCR